ncbi:MAG TPA: ABC transporter substrate-binding protein [Usitatibacter sp.]|nr:ABC transporter substrate-binding protein [Usitatibacter sp.]
MDRRAALGLLGAPFMACATRAHSIRLVRIGVVFYRVPRAALASPPRFFLAEALRSCLRERGWMEGQNIAFEWRSAEGREADIPAILEQLVASGVDLLALSGNNIVAPAMQLTTTVPIVMLASTSPLESGLVRSLSRPGANVTGMALNSQPELVGKRLELLKEAAPGIRSVALLHDGITRELEQADTQGKRLGLKLVAYAVDDARQLQEAMRDAARLRVDAVSVETSYVTAPSTHPEIRNVVEKYRLPMIHRFREAVAGGFALMSYSPDPVDDYRRACVMIDSILRGRKPGEIPIEVANKFYLDVNLRLAESIGWKIPASVVARADNIIR